LDEGVAVVVTAEARRRRDAGYAMAAAIITGIDSPALAEPSSSASPEGLDLQRKQCGESGPDPTALMTVPLGARSPETESGRTRRAAGTRVGRLAAAARSRAGRNLAPDSELARH
jgi:hypothetical protein